MKPNTTAQVSHELQSGDALLVPGDEEDRPKPDPQRQLGLVQRGAGGNRGLMATAVALKLPSRSQASCLPASAARTLKPVRPPPLKEILLTRGFGVETVLEIEKGRGIPVIHGRRLAHGTDTS